MYKKVQYFKDYMKESTINNYGIQYIPSYDEDRTYINAYINEKNIGSIIFQEIMEAYEYEFSDDISEYEFDNLFTEDVIIKLEHLEVIDEFKGKGISKELIEKGLGVMVDMGYTQFYLNASPMGFKGLSKNSLVKLYEKCGFITFLDQGGNALMRLIIKK